MSQDTPSNQAKNKAQEQECDAQNRPLAGKVAVITGSGRGIGRGIALALAAQGCRIAVNYMRKRGEAEATVATIEEMGSAATAIRAQIGREGEVERLVEEAAARLGSADIFVSNAASGVLSSAADLSRRAWDWTMDINARALLAGTQAALPYMRVQGWGRVISVSSIGGRRVVPDYAMIGASKAALEALTRYLAVELAAEGIVVNCVSPGLVATGALDAFPRRDAMLDHARRNTPAGRLITPEDVGALVAWLCSDAATMIVGQTIEIDGGYSLGMLHE